MSDTTDIVARLSGMSADHGPDGWPAVRMRDITALCEEVTRLRAALAQAGAGREPVGWGQLGLRNGHTYVRMHYEGHLYPPPADVARNLNLVPLYAHPSPAQREPLSDAQVLACVRSVGVPAPMGLTRDRGPYEVTEPTWFLTELVRAIERAHGITDSGTKGAA